MAALAELLSRATALAAEPPPWEQDATAERILDAAVLEAAAVGLRRFTVEDVVRRAGVGRMTAYRRFPRRDDLLQALATRETQRFLAAVSSAIEATADPREGVAAAFVAAVRFARDHPLLRRIAEIDAGAYTEALASEEAALLRTGADFIAAQIHGERPGAPGAEVRWVADVFARLFVSYVAIPPREPDFGDDAELRRFANAVLAPLVERVAPTPQPG